MSGIMELETPCVLVDEKCLAQNIEQMQQLANQNQVALRPHIKTHKSLEIAQRQIFAGAAGISASKSSEALVFIEAGITSVTIAYPLVEAVKLERVVAAAKSNNTDLRLIVDSTAGVRAIAAVAEKYQFLLKIYFKIDVGLHRCGFSEHDKKITELAAQIKQHPWLEFTGLLSHAGHSYAAPNAAAACEIAIQERDILLRVKNRLEQAGVPVAEISVGATPTVLAADDFTGITEIRPGNYVFMDRTPLRLNLIKPEQIALSVLATVVSKNTDYFIIDAGSKTLSSDAGAHGTKGVSGFGLAYPVNHFQQPAYEILVAKLSEEHGFLERGTVDLEIGARIRIIPNHSCVVANLVGEYQFVAADGGIRKISVSAQGKLW